MNDKQQELFDRLKRAANIIWGNPETTAEAILIFEEFVSSFEQIASDLAIAPDEQIARDLREIICSNPA